MKFIGMELGSTRIKTVLTDETGACVAAGEYAWENKLDNGLWTYELSDAWHGVQAAFMALKDEYGQKTGQRLTRVDAMGFSAMMHGYLAFDAQGGQLVPFRTWRNTNTGEAAQKLSELFDFNIPLRWSVSHIYQAMLDGEAHVENVASINTLAGYIHEKLTGRHVIGIGDASGMFPVDSKTGDYDAVMLEKFNGLAKDYPWKLKALLPRVLTAGESAGVLTAQGALLIDPSGELEAGIPLAPPEGDAGTGMAATDSVSPRTGNISAGTSVFSMAVLEKPLKKRYREIDIVASPSGAPVAMVHCNNCTSELNAWAELFCQFASACGVTLDMGSIFSAIFNAAMRGEKDCGGVLSCGFLSGEPVLGLDQGRPMLLRLPQSRFSFDNFARAQVLGAMAALRTGMDILKGENVRLERLTGHGGFFKTPGTAQKLLSAALNTPVAVMETAGEGGAWGMALLAGYLVCGGGQTLQEYLSGVFSGVKRVTQLPDESDARGFNEYMRRFTAALTVERSAVNSLED